MEISTPCFVPFPPNPPGGSFLELSAAVGNVAAVAVGMVGAAGLHIGWVLLCTVSLEIFLFTIMVLGGYKVY